MRHHLTALLSLGVATAVLAGPAFADTQYLLTDGTGFTSLDLVGSLHYVGNPPNYPAVTFNGNVYIGPLNMSVTDQTTSLTTTQTVYCTDIFDEFKSGGLYTLSATSLQGHLATQLGSSAQATAKVNQINALLNNVLPSPTDLASNAAIQAAIWEIENEPGTTNYSLLGGDFTASVNGGDETAFEADAELYLGNVGNGTWTAASAGTVWEYVVAQDQSANQSFSFLAANGGGNEVPLPEPATLSVLGLGLVGIATLRLRRQASKLPG